MKVGCKGVLITQSCYPDVTNTINKGSGKQAREPCQCIACAHMQYIYMTENEGENNQTSMPNWILEHAVLKYELDKTS